MMENGLFAPPPGVPTCVPCQAAKTGVPVRTAADAAGAAVAVGLAAGVPWPLVALLALALLGRRRAPS